MERKLTELDLKVLSIITKYEPVPLSQICKKIKKYSRQAVYSSILKLIEIGLVKKINDSENPKYATNFEEVYIDPNEDFILVKLPDGNTIAIFPADEEPDSLLTKIKRFILRK